MTKINDWYHPGITWAEFRAGIDLAVQRAKSVLIPIDWDDFFIHGRLARAGIVPIIRRRPRNRYKTIRRVRCRDNSKFKPEPGEMRFTDWICLEAGRAGISWRGVYKRFMAGKYPNMAVRRASKRSMFVRECPPDHQNAPTAILGAGKGKIEGHAINGRNHTSLSIFGMDNKQD